MKKAALLASAVLVMAMLVTGGVAYGRSSVLGHGITVPKVAPALSDRLGSARLKVKKVCLTRACAFVESDASLAPGVSHKGVLSVTHIATGYYCVELAPTIPAATTTPVASLDLAAEGSPVFLNVDEQQTCGTNGVIIFITYWLGAGNTGTVDVGFSISIP